MKRHCRQLLATEIFPWISKTSESSIIRQRKQVLEWLHISIRGILHFLLRTYLEYVKITILKADVNSNRRAVVNEYLLCYLGVYVFVI